MSLTGRLYKLSEKELSDLLKNNSDNFDHLAESIDLSYFAIDFLELISSFSGLDRNSIGKILQGKHSIEVDDGYRGYAKAAEVSEIKSKILDKISKDDFVNYLDQGARENQSREVLLKYFLEVKRIYEEAYSEGKCLLYSIG
jgi:hypothetical protein